MARFISHLTISNEKQCLFHICFINLNQSYKKNSYFPIYLIEGKNSNEIIIIHFNHPRSIRVSVGGGWVGNCENNRFPHHKYEHHMKCLNSQLGIMLQTTIELTMCHISKKPRYVFKCNL